MKGMTRELWIVQAGIFLGLGARAGGFVASTGLTGLMVLFLANGATYTFYGAGRNRDRGGRQEREPRRAAEKLAAQSGRKRHPDPPAETAPARRREVDTPTFLKNWRLKRDQSAGLTG